MAEGPDHGPTGTAILESSDTASQMAKANLKVLLKVGFTLVTGSMARCVAMGRKLCLMESFMWGSGGKDAGTGMDALPGRAVPVTRVSLSTTAWKGVVEKPSLMGVGARVSSKTANWKATAPFTGRTPPNLRAAGRGQKSLGLERTASPTGRASPGTSKTVEQQEKEPRPGQTVAAMLAGCCTTRYITTVFCGGQTGVAMWATSKTRPCTASGCFPGATAWADASTRAISKTTASMAMGPWNGRTLPAMKASSGLVSTTALGASSGLRAVSMTAPGQKDR
mmetsp:Transcript_12493/g.29760  ORF Transcript_12493/g.29760 Transcript_12493/m.29760 type:complete len:280 (+) Transcript_12493:524-1363(+)